MLKQHDVKNILGHHPFAIEDVMIGRMHGAYEEHLKSLTEIEDITYETIHNNRT